MALKRKITKEEHAKLSPELQAEYVESGDGFALDISGDEDNGALKRAKDREAQLRREAEKRAKEAEDKLAEINGEDARKRGDIETLEKSWKKQREDLETAFNEKLSKKDAFIKSTLVDSVARDLAGKISTAPALLLPHIKARLAADLDGEKPSTKILDKAGNLTTMTLDDLQKEFVANKDFASVIIGSKASGSSASTGNQKSAFGSANSSGKNQSLSGLTPSELALHIKAKREME